MIIMFGLCKAGERSHLQEDYGYLESAVHYRCSNFNVFYKYPVCTDHCLELVLFLNDKNKAKQQWQKYNLHHLESKMKKKVVNGKRGWKYQLQLKKISKPFLTAKRREN